MISSKTNCVLMIVTLLTPIAGTGSLRLHQIDPFENLNTGYKLPTENKPPSISIVAAQGEFEPARLLLDVSENWGESTVKISELKNDVGDTIPSSAFEIRSVHRWRQLIPHAYIDGDEPPHHEVDELLLFDDTTSISGAWTAGKYKPPRVSAKFRTNLLAGQPKQLWLTARVAERQPQGRYEGQLVLSTNNKRAIIPVTLNVLPFKLPVSDKFFGIFYRGSLAENKRHVSKEDLLAQLTDIRHHGFNSLAINEYSLEHLPDFIDIYKNAGFEGPAVLKLPKLLNEDEKYLDAIATIFMEAGIKYFIYGIDEPNTRQKIAEQIAFQHSLASDSPVFTSLLSSTDDKLLYRGVAPDWANLNIKSGVNDLRTKSSQDDRTITYYWQSYLEDAPRNRYYAGAFLLKTDLDGIYPYVYQAFHSIEPFTTDTRALGGSEIRSNRQYKAFNTAYPAAGSSIPTIQWESLREGIDDYRYAQLLKNLAASKSPQALKEITWQLNSRLARINYEESKSFKVNTEFNASSLSNLRNWMIKRILELNGP